MSAAKKTTRPEGAECPLCRHRFPVGTTGWYSHIGTLRNHPNWHPHISDPNERKRLFAAEFPEFFKDAWTPSRQRPPSVVPTAPAPPRPAPLEGAAPRFCSQCGAPVASASSAPPRFCAQCGSPLYGAATPPPPPARQPA